MTYYREADETEAAAYYDSCLRNPFNVKEILGVPVEPCEHGNYAEHIVSVQVWAGVPTWCPGAGIGDTDGE